MFRIVLIAALMSGSLTSWDFQGIYTGQNVRDIVVGAHDSHAVTEERFILLADGDDHVKVADSDCPMRFRRKERTTYVLEEKTCRSPQIAVTFKSGKLVSTSLGHITMTWEGTFQANGKTGTIKATYQGRRINR